ncbi:formyl peptide receptor-related sequence 3-like [Pyxicephalus adspersus]|uniref:formyl peptide receptor-related sequence 3-like n=1 Tax=Pyxicephalus adspersus TaxID=30357 RepID=UPI003B594AA0
MGNETSIFDDSMNMSTSDEVLDDQNRTSSVPDEYIFYINIKIIIIMSIIWYSVTLVLGIIGNGLVIWIAGFKMKTVSSLWFLHLAIADFITCISLPLRISEWALFFDIPYDHYLCTIGITLLYINMSTSVYFMSIIGIDRCVSVFWPIWTKIHRTPRKAWIISILTWVLSLLTSIPYVLFNHFFEEITECYPKHWYFEDEEEKIKIRNTMFIIKNICMFAFPFTIILISYTLVFFKIRKLRKLNKSQRPLRLMVAVVMCFFIFWFPYNTWPFITINARYGSLDRLIAEICVSLAYFSSCINPIIYVFFCHDFKKNFIKSLPATLNKAFNEDSDLAYRDGGATMHTNANLETSML